MALQTLGLTPDREGFQVDEGNTNTFVQLDGGGPRVRADQQGAVKLVNCQWTLNPAQFDYMMAFYRTGTANGASPFNISLCGIDNAEVSVYQAQFVPGTFQPLAEQSGLAYLVKAQMFVWPLPVNATADNALIAAGAPA